MISDQHSKHCLLKIIFNNTARHANVWTKQMTTRYTSWCASKVLAGTQVLLAKSPIIVSTCENKYLTTRWQYKLWCWSEKEITFTTAWLYQITYISTVQHRIALHFTCNIQTETHCNAGKIKIECSTTLHATYRAFSVYKHWKIVVVVALSSTANTLKHPAIQHLWCRRIQENLIWIAVR